LKVTPHFWIYEFDCRDGTNYPEKWIESRLTPLCKSLELIRAEVGGPLHITSGYRTAVHNRRIGGAMYSQHLTGRAADISPRDVTAARLHLIIDRLIRRGDIPDGGLGKYQTFVHYDQRGYRARW